MSTINFNNIQNNAVFKFGKISNVNSDFNYNEFEPLINAVEIDWNGAQVDENTVIKRKQSPKDSVARKVKSRNEENSIQDTKSQEIGFNKQNPKLFSFKDISSKRIDSFSYVREDESLRLRCF